MQSEVIMHRNTRARRCVTGGTSGKRCYNLFFFFCWEHNTPRWIILLQHADELDRHV